MTLDEYIAKNFSEEKMNEDYSHYSGWHIVILDIVRQTWEAAKTEYQHGDENTRQNDNYQ